MTWHLLQISDVLDVEFGSALAATTQLMAWEPVRVPYPGGLWNGSREVRRIADPPLLVRPFPLMRGFARFPVSIIANTGRAVVEQLLRETNDPTTTPLICTTPYLAPVATRWPGPVVYWLTDRIESYRGAKRSQVHKLDREICRCATLVCPNSKRLSDYLVQHGACPGHKIHILPNATRETNLLPAVIRGPGEVPETLNGLPRPIAGIIGNLAGNMDWIFLEELISKSPKMSWAFVGPVSMPIQDSVQRFARERVMRMARTRFVGRQAYGDLASYARSFDVALLPYRRCEPTYSGSSTRFYEHLAACRPMVATRGFEELTLKEPLLRLVDSSDEAAMVIASLQETGFDDGLSELRWQEARTNTWQRRAEDMKLQLAMRLDGGCPKLSRLMPPTQSEALDG